MEKETLVSEVVMIDLVYWDSYCIIGYGPIVICPNPPTQKQNCLAQSEFNISQFLNSRRDVGTDVDSGESSGGERIIEILETDVDSGRSCRRPGLIEIQVKHFSFEDGELIENNKTTYPDNEDDESVRKTTDTDEAEKDIRRQLDGILSKKNSEMKHLGYLSPASQNDYHVNANDSLNPDSTSNSVSNGLLSTTFDSLSDDVFETESQTEARKGLLMYTLHRSKGNLDLRVENTSDSASTNVQKSEGHSDDKGDEKTSECERSFSQENFKAKEEGNEAGLELLVVKKSDIIGSCDETMSLSLESLSTDLTGSSQSGSYSLPSLFDSETEVDRREEIITVRKSDSFEHKTKHAGQQLQIKHIEKNDVCGRIATESLENSEAKALNNNEEEAAAGANLSSQLNVDDINAEFDVSEETIVKTEPNNNAASADIIVSEKNTNQDNVSGTIYFKEDDSCEKIEGRYAETFEKMEEGNARAYVTQNNTSNIDDSAVESETEILTQRQVENDEGNDSDDTSESMSVSVDLEICVRVDLGTARDRGDKLFLSHTNNEDGALALEESSSNEYSFLAFTRMFKDKKHPQLIENKSASQNSFQKDSAEKIAKQIVEKVLRASQNMVAETTDKALSERTGHLMELTYSENENQLLFNESKQKEYEDNNDPEIKTPMKECLMHQEKSHNSVQQNEHRQSGKHSANTDNIHEKDLTQYKTDGIHIIENGYQEQTSSCVTHIEEKKSVVTEDEIMPKVSVQQIHKLSEINELHVESTDTNANQNQAEETEQVLKKISAVQGEHLGQFDIKSKSSLDGSEQRAGISDSEKSNVIQSSHSENITLPEHSKIELERLDTLETEEVKLKREERVEIKGNTELAELSDVGHISDLKAHDIVDDFNSKINKNAKLQNDEPYVSNNRLIAETNEQHLNSQETTIDMLDEVISSVPKEEMKSKKSEYMPDLFENNKVQIEKLSIEVKVDENPSVQEQAFNINTNKTHEEIQTAKSDELLETDTTSDSLEDTEATQSNKQPANNNAIKTSEDIEVARSDEQFETDYTIQTRENIESARSYKEPVIDNIETLKDIEIAQSVELLQSYSTMETQEDIDTAKVGDDQQEHENTTETQVDFKVDNNIKQHEAYSTSELHEDTEAAKSDEKPLNHYNIENKKDIDATKSVEQTEAGIYIKTQDKSDDKNEIDKRIETNEDIRAFKSDEQPEIDKAIETEETIDIVKSDEQPQVVKTSGIQEDIEPVKIVGKRKSNCNFVTKNDIEALKSDELPEIDYRIEYQEETEAVKSDEHPVIDSTFESLEEIVDAQNDIQSKIGSAIESQDDIKIIRSNEQPEGVKTVEVQRNIETATIDEQEKINSSFEIQDIESARSKKQVIIGNNIETNDDNEAQKRDEQPEINEATDTYKDIETAKSDELQDIKRTVEVSEDIQAVSCDEQSDINDTIGTREDFELERRNKQQNIKRTNETQVDIETTINGDQQDIYCIHETVEEFEAAQSTIQPEFDNNVSTQNETEAAKIDEKQKLERTTETKVNAEATRIDDQPEINCTTKTLQAIETVKRNLSSKLDRTIGKHATSETAESNKQTDIDYTIGIQEDIGAAKNDAQHKIDSTIKSEDDVEAAKVEEQQKICSVEIQEDNKTAICDGVTEIGSPYNAHKDIEAPIHDEQPERNETFESKEDIEATTAIGDETDFGSTRDAPKETEIAGGDKPPETDEKIETLETIDATNIDENLEINYKSESKESCEVTKSNEQPETIDTIDTQGSVEVAKCDKQPELDYSFETGENIEVTESDPQPEIDNAIEIVEVIEAARNEKQPEIDKTIKTEEAIEAVNSYDHQDNVKVTETQEDIEAVRSDETTEVDCTIKTQKGIETAKSNGQPEIENTSETKENIEAAETDEQSDIIKTTETQGNTEVSRNDDHEENDKAAETQIDTEAIIGDEQVEIINTIELLESIETAQSFIQPFKDNSMETIHDIEATESDELTEFDSNKCNQEDIEGAKCDEQQEVDSTIESQGTIGSARSDKLTENVNTIGNKEYIEQIKRESQLDIDNPFQFQVDEESSKSYKRPEIVDIIEIQEDTKAAKIRRHPETDSSFVTQEDIETTQIGRQIEIDITIETEEDIKIARDDKQPEIDNTIETQNTEASEIDKQQEIDIIGTIESQVEEIILVDNSEAENAEQEAKVSDTLELEKVNSCDNLGNNEKFQSDRKTELADSQQVYFDIADTHKIQTAAVEDKTTGGQKDKQQNISFSSETQNLKPTDLEETYELNKQQDETVVLETKVQNPKNEHQTEEQEISDSFETDIDIGAEKSIPQQSGCYICDREFDMPDTTKIQEVKKTDTESNIDTQHFGQEHCITDAKHSLSCFEEFETEESEPGLEISSSIKAQEETGIKGSIETDEIDQEQNRDETHKVKPSCLEANKSEQELQISSSIKAQEVNPFENEDRNTGNIPPEISDAVYREKEEGSDIVGDDKKQSSAEETDMCCSIDIQGMMAIEMENKSEAEPSQQVTGFPENTETQETKTSDSKLEASECEEQLHIQKVELNGIKETVEVLEVNQQADLAEKLVMDKIASDIYLTGDVEQCDSQTNVLDDDEHVHQCKINSLRKRYQRKETKQPVCSNDSSVDSSDSIDDTGQYHPELYEQLTVPVCQDSQVESVLVKPEIGCLLRSEDGKTDENKKYNDELNEQEMHMSENEINQPKNDSTYMLQEQRDDTNLKQNIPDECQGNSVSCIYIENVDSSDEDSENIDDSGQYHPELYVKRQQLDCHPELYVKRPELDCSDTDKGLVSMNATNLDHSNIVLSKDMDYEDLHNEPKENLQTGFGHSKDKQITVLSVSACKLNIGEKKDGTVTQHAEYTSDNDTDSESIDDTGQYHPELYTQLTLPLSDKDKNGGNNNEEPSAKNSDTNQHLQEARLNSSKEDCETETFDTNASTSDFTSGRKQDTENIQSSSGESEGLNKYVENVGKSLKVSSSHESMSRSAGSIELFKDVSGDFENTEATFTDSDISKSALGDVGVTGFELRNTVSQNVVDSIDIKDKNTFSKHKSSTQVQEHFDEISRIPIEVSVKINDMPGKTKRVQESKKKSKITNVTQEISDIRKIDVHIIDKKMDNSEINMIEVEEEKSHAKEKSKRKNNKRPYEPKNADKHTVGVKEDTLTKRIEQNRESRSKTVKQPVEAEDFKKKSKSKSKSPDKSHHNKKELSCYPGDDELVSVKSEKLRAVDKVTDKTCQGKEEKERKKHSKRSEERQNNETKKDVMENLEEDRVREGKSKEKKAKDSDKVFTAKTELSYKAEDENVESKNSGSTSQTVKRSKHGNCVEVIQAEIHPHCDTESIEKVMKDEFDIADDEDVKSKSGKSPQNEEQNIKDKPVDLSPSDQQGNEQTIRKRSIDGEISGPLADDIDEDTEGSVDPTVVSHKLEKWLQEKRDISIRKETERFIKGGIPEEKLHIKQRVQATANEQRRQRSRDEIESGYNRRERSKQNSLEHQYRRSRQGSHEQIYRSPDGVYGRSRHNSQEGIYVSRRGSQEGLYRRSRQNSVDGVLERSSYGSWEGNLTRSRKSSQDEGVRSYMNSPDGRISRNSQSSQEEINERFRNRYQNEAVHERNRYNSQNERYIRSRHNSMDNAYRHSGDGQENDILRGRDVYERHKHGTGEISDHKNYKDDDIYGYNEEHKNNRKDVFEKCRQCSHDDMYERKELSRQNSSEQLNESRKSPVFDEEFLEGRLGRKADYIEVKKFRRENKSNDKRRANFLTSAQLRIFCEPKKKTDKPIIGPIEMVSVSYERQKNKENERKTIELNTSIEETKNIDEHSSYSSSLQPKTFDVYRYEKHHKRGRKSNMKLDKMDRVDDQYRDNRVQLNESGFPHKDWEHRQIHNRNVSAAETSHSELYHVNQYSKNRCAKKHDASVGTKVVTANANQGNGDAFYLSDPDYVHVRSKYQQNLRGQKYPKNPNGPKDNSRMKLPAGSRETSKDGPLSLTDTFAPMERGHSENHNMSNPNLSAGKLSDSTTSLNNRQAPAKSPSRQNTLQKQTSIQSNQSEINGEKREDPHGIKFERLKNLEEDELMAKIKEIIGHLEKLEDYHRGDGMRIQKMLGDMYWDYTHLREMIADCMAENGYAVVSMKMLKTLNGIGIFKNDDVWFPTYYTYNTMWNFSDASSNLARTLSENDAVRLLTLNCGHKPYINALHSKNVFYVIKASLSILHNMARNSGMKHLFDENKTSETVMPFMESEDEMLKILATLTIANIVDEEENKTVIAETGTIHCMVSWIEKAISLPRRRFKGFTPQELTEGLNKLAVNDSNKMRIIEEGAIPLFHLMLQHEDVREQSSAGRIIWTLSFDKDVRHKLIENTDLIATLEKLTESTNKSVQQNANGALWIIKGENDISRETKPKGTPTKSHVFLSYSWSDKDTVLMIRDKLRSEGYAVWIDIEKGSSASLEGMANAIENSAVVLICMSEKYKQNPNCRTEAEYTFQLKKDYIPLMLQKKYRPDGWLGFILGAKLYFDFSGKYPFDKSFTGLLKELRGRGQVTPNTTPVGSNETSDGAMATSQSLTSYASPGTPVPSHSVLLSMGQEELVKWLRNVKLTECIPAFLEFDGKLLMQLKQMRVEAPEFFYQCLEKRLNMSLIEILKFTRALEELH